MGGDGRTFFTEETLLLLWPGRPHTHERPGGDTPLPYAAIRRKNKRRSNRPIPRRLIPPVDGPIHSPKWEEEPWASPATQCTKNQSRAPKGAYREVLYFGENSLADGECKTRHYDPRHVVWIPAGFLLGFIRWCRNSSGTPLRPTAKPPARPIPDPKERELLRQLQAAPTTNRQFHAFDLCRLIGHAAYEPRVLDIIRKFGCQRFSATLAVHGRAVLAGEISR